MMGCGLLKRSVRLHLIAGASVRQDLSYGVAVSLPSGPMFKAFLAGTSGGGGTGAAG